MSESRGILASVLLMLGMSMCGGEGGRVGQEAQVGARASASVHPQGVSMQGVSMQGVSMQGVSMQGVSLQGVSLQGVSLQGMSLFGTVLSGQMAIQHGQVLTLSGADLVGATLSGILSDGTSVLLRIDAVDVDAGDATGEILLYTVVMSDGAGGWSNLCQPDPDGAQKAVPLAGVWDPRGTHHDSADLFTLGCTSGVIAKCARWGYKPWETVEGRSLADFHQACTRMARADYCGDGVSHTKNGTYIDMYDVLGIQRQASRDGMMFEAAWLPGGAYCMARPRWNLVAAELVVECQGKLAWAGLGDVLNVDSCLIKMSTESRAEVLISNRSFLQLSL